MCKCLLTKVVFGLSIAVILFAPAAVSLADLVNVDIDTSGIGSPSAGTYSGTAAAGGGTWNSFNVTQYPNNHESGILVNSEGNATSAAFGTDVKITLGPSGFNGHDWLSGGVPNWGTDLVCDGLYTMGSTSSTGGSWTISGLVAGTNYDLYLYGQAGDTYGNTTNVKIGEVTKTSTNPGTPLLSVSTYLEDRNYVKFSSVAADGSGTISALVWDASGSAGMFNGFQISEIPEPGTLALLATGLLGLLAYAWRKRK